MALIRCKRCKYYKDGADGICRRYPPSVTIVNPNSVGNETVWPKVAKEDCCGEGAVEDSNGTVQESEE